MWILLRFGYLTDGAIVSMGRLDTLDGAPVLLRSGSRFTEKGGSNPPSIAQIACFISAAPSGTS